MHIISEQKSFALPNQIRTAIAIGKFDGIHIGHKKILDEIILAKKQGMTAVVFTFNPSPEEFFSKEKLPVLDTREEKRAKFDKMGIDYLIEFPLTTETAAMSPKHFMQDILLNNLHAALVVSGTDLSFGDKGSGNADLLADFAKEKGFTYKIIEKVCANGKEVSSTRIREAVLNGYLEEANAMLGEPYCLNGKIIHGNHLGHSLNMPTVNIIPQDHKLLPPRGVYATISEIQGESYFGVTNIGFKPTVSNKCILGAETFLYHFSGDIYGENIHTRLLHFMRPEQRFTNVEALKEQLMRDKDNGMQYFQL